RDFHVTGVQTCALPISVGFASCFFTDSLGNFFLKHSRKFNYLFSHFQRFENNLRRNIVGEISDYGKMVSAKYFLEIILQKILFDNMSVQFWIIFFEITN